MDSQYADEKIDLDNRYFAPGFIDCHVHLIRSEFGTNGMETPRAFAAASCKGAANTYTLLNSGVVACWDLRSWKGLVLEVRDAIEHGVFMTEAIMDLMKEKDAFFVPTLCAPYYAVHEGLRREPNNPDHIKSKEIFERHRDILRRCSEKGIKIDTGTDAVCPFNPYEKAPHEMALMMEAGLSAEAALRASTRGGAALLRLMDLDSLEPGKRACFLGLNANPLEQIDSVDDKKAVILDGKFVC